MMHFRIEHSLHGQKMQMGWLAGCSPYALLFTKAGELAKADKRWSLDLPTSKGYIRCGLNAAGESRSGQLRRYKTTGALKQNKEETYEGR